MNKVLSLNTILKRVKFSQKLMEKPWLKPVYDDPKFLVRMIWRRYGGWWDGEYDRLLPETREKESQELVTLAGGAKKVCDIGMLLNPNNNDGKFVSRLRSGARVTPETWHKVQRFIKTNGGNANSSLIPENLHLIPVCIIPT